MDNDKTILLFVIKTASYTRPETNESI